MPVKRPLSGMTSHCGFSAGDLFPGIVNLPEDKEEIVPLAGVGKEGQSARSNSTASL